MSWADDFTWVEKVTTTGPTNLNKLNKAIRDLKAPTFDVMSSDYGAAGNGTTDDTTAIVAALAAAAAATNSVVLLRPSKTFKTTGVLTVPAGVRLVGHGATLAASVSVADPNTGSKSAITVGRGGNARIEGLTIDGGSVSQVGIEISGYNDGQIQNLLVRDVEITGCTVAGVKLRGGYRGKFDRCYIHDNQVGVLFDTYANDYLSSGPGQWDFVSCWIQTNTAENVLIQSGGQINFFGGNIEHAGTYGVHINPTGAVAGPVGLYSVNIEQNGDYTSGVGVVAKTLTRGLTMVGCQFIGNAANLKQWKAYDIQAGASGVFIAGGNIQGHSTRPTVAASTETTFIPGAAIGSAVLPGNYPVMLTRAGGGFTAELGVEGSDSAINLWLTPKGAGAAIIPQSAIIDKRIALTYGTTVSTDSSLGNEFDITVTNGTAFTVALPTNLNDGQRVTYTIRNTSGGAMGVITWANVFKLSAFTNPPNGFSRSITFRHDGSNLVEVSRTPADVPN